MVPSLAILADTTLKASPGFTYSTAACAALDCTSWLAGLLFWPLSITMEPATTRRARYLPVTAKTEEAIRTLFSKNPNRNCSAACRARNDSPAIDVVLKAPEHSRTEHSPVQTFVGGSNLLASVTWEVSQVPRLAPRISNG